jgi:hypothetical protein
MKLDLLRSLVAPAFACLFLILAVCALPMRTRVSSGFAFPMIRLQHDPNEMTDCGGRSEFVRLTKDGKTWINNDEIPADRIPSAIATIMENRAERVVYVIVDSEMSFGQFAHFVDRIEGSTADLHVVLVSGEVRRAFERNHDLCDFRYPEKYF